MPIAGSVSRPDHETGQYLADVLRQRFMNNTADTTPARRLPGAIPWHPVLFAATVVLAYWLDTVVSPYAAFRSLLVAVIGAGLLTLVLWALTRNGARAGVIASTFIGLLYSKHLAEFAFDVQELAPTWLFITWIVAIVAVTVLAFRMIRKRAASWTAWRVNNVLNWAGVLYLGSTIAMGLLSGKFAYAAGELDQGVSLAEATRGHAAHPGSTVPDIYLILLDGYPRADVLADAFDFDNSDFVASLEERGFSVATESRSDYLWTRQSLTSMLHMDYVEQIPEFLAVLEGRAPQNPDLRELANENPAFDLARESGYQVVATAYEFEELALRQADVYVDPGYLNEFEFKLLVSTFLGDAMAVVAPDFASSQHRDWINYQLRSLGKIARADAGSGPRLVLGHIPAPHQPTVFGPNGEPIVVPISRLFYADSPLERGEPAGEFANKYRAQLGYLNGRFLEMVDAILANSEQPPVIVLWADHGSASRVDWVVTTPDEAEPSTLRERTRTLFASFTPGKSGVFPNDITPASIFRFLSDGYFGTEYGRAPAIAGYGD